MRCFQFKNSNADVRIPLHYITLTTFLGIAFLEEFSRNGQSFHLYVNRLLACTDELQEIQQNLLGRLPQETQASNRALHTQAKVIKVTFLIARSVIATYTLRSIIWPDDPNHFPSVISDPFFRVLL
ncbi:unnamed protein product, partial [Allacma fusca]